MFQSHKKWILSVVVLGLAVFFVTKLNRIDSHVREISTASNHFNPSNVMCVLDPNPKYDIQMSPDLISFVNVITQQPFKWLARGFQAYAFESQDGEYVVKFIQQHRLRDRAFSEHPIEYIFSKSYREKMAFNKEHRNEIFDSSKISFEDIPEETGMLFIHLNKTEGLLHGIRLVDCLGTAYKVKPDGACFLIQRKAKYILPTITELMRNGDIEGAKARVNQVIDLLVSLARKGVVDSDYALIRNNNIGFVKDRAVYIDTGHISKHTDLDAKKQMEYEFKRRLKPLCDWLHVKYPELAMHYEAHRGEVMLALTREQEALHASTALNEKKEAAAQ
jgi:hypothetical protein